MDESPPRRGNRLAPGGDAGRWRGEMDRDRADRFFPAEFLLRPSTRRCGFFACSAVDNDLGVGYTSRQLVEYRLCKVLNLAREFVESSDGHYCLTLIAGIPFRKIMPTLLPISVVSLILIELLVVVLVNSRKQIAVGSAVQQ